MNEKVVTAIGNNIFTEYLRNKGFQVIEDIPYQEAVIEFLKKELVDAIIIFENLPGENNKYIFIEKIKEIDKKLKIIIILEKEDDNYKSFLYSKGIFDVFIDGKNSIEELISKLSYKATESDYKGENRIGIKEYGGTLKNDFKSNLVPKFQKQQIISFVGVGSYGKTTIATQFSKILSENIKAKILLIDLDIVNADVNRIIGVNASPNNPEYILPNDKNSSLNYMVEAIDKRVFNTNIFERYIVKSKKYTNLDVLTGSRSLYVCKNVLSSEYYSRILETAKAIYDYIIIDTSSNIFLDSMQFALLNSNKIFVVTEGNYIALERTCRLLSELFPVWGIGEKKAEVIINKYSSKSLSKIEIKEILNKYYISGYISFSEYYQEIINANIEIKNNALNQEYNFLLKNLELNQNVYAKKENISDILLKTKNKVSQKLLGRMGDIC